MKIYFIEWKYIFYRIKIFYQMKIYFYCIKIFLWNENIFLLNANMFLSNENNFYRILLHFGNHTNEGSATSTVLDENLTCEFKRKNSFTLFKSCMKPERFLLLVKSSLFHI